MTMTAINIFPADTNDKDDTASDGHHINTDNNIHY